MAICIVYVAYVMCVYIYIYVYIFIYALEGPISTGVFQNSTMLIKKAADKNEKLLYIYICVCYMKCVCLLCVKLYITDMRFSKCVAVINIIVIMF